MHESMTYTNRGAASVLVCGYMQAKELRMLKEFEELAGVLKFNKVINTGSSGATICSPLFLAASSGEQAFAKPGKLTLFCEALMSAPC